MNLFATALAAWHRVRPPVSPTMLSAHFAIAEAGCRDGCPVPLELLANARALAAELEVLRAELGRPIRVNSWWRSAAHNAKVGSTEASQHRLAKAADLVVAGMTPAALHGAIERLIAARRMQEGGLGLYPGFTHYDIRGRRARWRGGDLQNEPKWTNMTDIAPL